MSTTVSVATPAIEPATQRFIDAIAAAGNPALPDLSPDAANKVLPDLQSQPVPLLTVRDAPQHAT